jgi:hypothetical protein
VQTNRRRQRVADSPDRRFPMRSGIAARLLLAFLVVSILPISILAYYR